MHCHEFRATALIAIAVGLAAPACSASVRGPRAAVVQPTVTLPGGPLEARLPMAPNKDEGLLLSDGERAQADVGEQLARLVPRVVTGSRWLDVVLLAPSDAKIHVSSQAMRVAGIDFALEVVPNAPDLFLHKSRTLRPGRDAHLRAESSDTQVFQIGERWEFVTMVETGGKFYSCRSAPDHFFSHEEVLVMVRSCWSLTSRSVAADDTVR